MSYPVLEQQSEPWFRADAAGRFIPTPAFLEHVLVIVGHDLGWRSVNAAGRFLSGDGASLRRLLQQGGVPNPVTTAKLCGVIDGWFTGYSKPAPPPPTDPKDLLRAALRRDRESRMDLQHQAWVRYQAGRGITAPAPSRRRAKPPWHEGMRKWPPLLPSAPDGELGRAMTRELSRYVLDSTAYVLFANQAWAKQRGPLAQLLGIRRRTLDMWRHGYKMHRGLVFKALALRILVAGGNLRVYADQYGEPMWHTFEWGKVGTWPGDRLYRFERAAAGRPRKRRRGRESPPEPNRPRPDRFRRAKRRRTPKHGGRSRAA